MAATKARDSAGRALSALGARLLETSPRKRGKITGKNLSILILDVHRSELVFCIHAKRGDLCARADEVARCR